MALRRYFACDASEQFALRRKEDQEGLSLDLLLVLLLSESVGAYRTKFLSNLNSGCHLHHPAIDKALRYHFNLHQQRSVHPGSRVDNGQPHFSAQHSPNPSHSSKITRALTNHCSVWQMSHFTKINLNHNHEKLVAGSPSLHHW